MLTAEVKKALLTADLIITIGNDLRSDDGLGPYIAKNCQSSKILDAFDKPENIIEPAIARKPKSVLIIDAADFGGQVGEALLVKSENIPDTTLSTHTFPLKVIAKMIETDAQAEVKFLGVQPRSVELGETMSVEVKMVAEEIIGAIA
ncbi:MAG: hydrogenase 3 maturation endopeptidase HyCI [bacterium]